MAPRLALGLMAFAVFVCGISSWSGEDILAEEKNLKWWRTGIVYQAYPRSFKDSNGDGIGDLPGITSKLSYLKHELNVSAVWLSPIYPSPQADFGYDISNFTDVDPNYGTLEDFDKLVEESHNLGLKVVLDLVPNHSSDEHVWFVASEDPDHPEHAKYKDYYIWLDPKGWNGTTPIVPNNWLSVFRGSGWTYSPKRKQFYFHQFHRKQPDFNFRNRAVAEEMKDVIRFWIHRKVDGFRVDAAPFLFEDPEFRNENRSYYTDDPDDHAYLLHTQTQNLPETYDTIVEWREVLEEDGDKDRVLMIEAYCSVEDTMKYYGTKERPGAHFPFNFYLITDVRQASNATDFKRAIDKWMEQMTEDRWPNWVIGNHDQKRVATRYGPELADSLNMISLTLPGTAMTYNGEEIGMVDNFIRWEDTLDPQAINKGQDAYLSVSRDPCRTPFQWDDTTSAGFSTNISTWLPINPNYWQLNVKEQISNQRSHLHLYKRLVEARREPTLQIGELNVTVEGPLLIIKRTLKDHPTFLLLVNFGTKEYNYTNPDLEKMSIWVSSINAGLQKGWKAGNPVVTQAKGGYLLTDKAISNSSRFASAGFTILVLFMLISLYNKLHL